MRPVSYLRLEGAALFTVAAGAYLVVGEPLWLFALLLFAPELSMIAYLRGPRVGAIGYNAAHTTVVPLVVAGLSVWQGATLPLAVALIWLAHIGGDRALEYGLKHADGFGRTHLGPVGRGRGDAGQTDPTPTR